MKDESGALRHIAIGGKKIRGTTDHKKPFTSAMGTVSAWCNSAGLVLGQNKYDFGENHEKHATLDLIRVLHLKGAIVSLDANGATQDILSKMTEKKIWLETFPQQRIESSRLLTKTDRGRRHLKMRPFDSFEF